MLLVFYVVVECCVCIFGVGIGDDLGGDGMLFLGELVENVFGDVVVVVLVGCVFCECELVEVVVGVV